MAKIQTLLNNNLRNRLSKKIRATESHKNFLIQYIDIYKQDVENNVQKKLNKFEQKELLVLRKYEIESLTNEEYKEVFLTPKIEKLDKKFYWKKRAVKHKANKQIKKHPNNQKIYEKLRDEKLLMLAAEYETLKEKITNETVRNFSLDDIKKNKDLFNQQQDNFKQRYNALKSELEKDAEKSIARFVERQNLLIEKTNVKLDALKQTYDEKYHTSQYSTKLNNNEILKLDNLTMQFGGLRAVDNLSFTVKEGEIFGLIGPNGAGKTTVFNCITQFYKATSGEIFYKNRLNETLRLNDYLSHQVIGEGVVRTFQNVELVWELNILDNMLVGAHSTYHTGLLAHMFRSKKLRQEEEITRNKAIKILNDLDIAQYMYAYPVGLPYGILKKIELARTLMTNPNLIILDEPAAGLNDAETIELAKTIKKIQKEYACTIFLVEHDMGLVMDICDTICAISFGKLLAIGTPKEIQNNPAVQEAYLGGS